MKLRLTALATVAATLTASGSASAAELTVEPRLPCYGSGHSVSLHGEGFSPNLRDGILITRDGDRIGPNSSVSSDATGTFTANLSLGQENGRRISEYMATDTSNPMLTASTQITVSEAEVMLRPKAGAPGRRVRIRAVGFTAGGKRLWAHVTHSNRTRNFPVGRLRGACKRVTKSRRLLPRNARVGVYVVQFDAFRQYKARRSQSVGYTITVRPVRRPAAAASTLSWKRLG